MIFEAWMLRAALVIGVLFLIVGLLVLALEAAAKDETL